ncbi:hypothetical protein IMZ48_13025 [Candidatus Bathyarchaeota archaeon]|nr:hypothetical protein [Candidatus Bathyarchaeota archaeon]
MTYTVPSSSQNGEGSYPSNSKCVASDHESASKGSSALKMIYTGFCKLPSPSTRKGGVCRRGRGWPTLSHLEASSCAFSSSTSVVKIQKVSSSYRSVGAQTPLPTVKAELL